MIRRLISRAIAAPPSVGKGVGFGLAISVPLWCLLIALGVHVVARCSE